MTDKIIIDGVDVKDCKRRIGKNSYCRYFKRPCADNNFNCIWKQHERLKEENENLKQQLEIDKNQINYFIEENEKQKEQIKQLEDFIKSDGEIDHINHEYTYKLKKVLQDIKTLVTTDYIQNKKQLVQNYDCLDNFMQKIEEKCNEVLE